MATGSSVSATGCRAGSVIRQAYEGVSNQQEKALLNRLFVP
jgi:hypothetical protein